MSDPLALPGANGAAELDAIAGTTPDLDALYAPPAERIQKSVLNYLTDFHRAYLEAATFFVLASGSDRGLDASPRGGPAGFVHMFDPHHVAFADWPGNNRIESLRNLVRDERVGMLFIYPGLEVFMRINGIARVSTEPSLLARVGEGKVPKTAIVVEVKEVLLHCGKAINRADLWAPQSRLAPDTVPSIGQMVAAMGKLSDAAASIDQGQLDQVTAHYQHSVRHDLY